MTQRAYEARSQISQRSRVMIFGAQRENVKLIGLPRLVLMKSWNYFKPWWLQHRGILCELLQQGTQFECNENLVVCRTGALMWPWLSAFSCAGKAYTHHRRAPSALFLTPACASCSCMHCGLIDAGALFI